MTTPADDWITSGQWEAVSSSNVNSIRYDRISMTLEVRFDGVAKGVTNPIYKYAYVPPIIAKMFYNAKSKGRYVWQHFRSGPYKTTGPF